MHVYSAHNVFFRAASASNFSEASPSPFIPRPPSQDILSSSSFLGRGEESYVGTSCLISGRGVFGGWGERKYSEATFAAVWYGPHNEQSCFQSQFPRGQRRLGRRRRHPPKSRVEGGKRGEVGRKGEDIPPPPPPPPLMCVCVQCSLGGCRVEMGGVG